MYTEQVSHSENNFLDLQVIYDPKNNGLGSNGTYVLRTYTNQDKTERGNVNLPDQTLIDGILIPIINLTFEEYDYKTGETNEFVVQVDKTEIQEFKLKCIDTCPSIELKITTETDAYDFREGYGYGGTITVKILDSENSPYKKSSLDFDLNLESIDSQLVSFTGKGKTRYTLKMSGSYKYLQLEETLNEAFTKKIDAINGFYDAVPNTEVGEVNEKVIEKDVSNSKISTFELFRQICDRCNIGFAVSPGCEEVLDEKRFITSSRKPIEILNDAVVKGGGDGNSDNVFSWWIDIYGYINLVNLPYLLNTPIQPEQLKGTMMSGIHSTEENTPSRNPILTDRTIHNLLSGGPNNLLFNFYKLHSKTKITSSKTIVRERPKGIGDNENTVEKIDIEPKNINQSVAYNPQVIYVGGEYEEDPVLLQKEVVNSYIETNINREFVEVQMDVVNYSLLRGQLINLVYFYDSSGDAARGVYRDPSKTDEEKDKIVKGMFKDDENPLVTNNSKSGMFYIKGTEYLYIKGVGKIVQTLYLVKKQNYKNETKDPYSL